MMKLLSDRQKQLVTMLNASPEGCAVRDLAKGLKITKNAVRQQLAGLERDGLVAVLGTEATGGRPRELYALTDAGREVFPRQYPWFGELLLEALKDELGSSRLKDKLFSLGQSVGRSLAGPGAAGTSRAGQAELLAAAMEKMGYQARRRPGTRADQTIEATNCVFHRLAERHPEVCQFDLGLMAAFAKASVTHEECMVRGGRVCRFRLSASPKAAAKPP